MQPQKPQSLLSCSHESIYLYLFAEGFNPISTMKFVVYCTKTDTEGLVNDKIKTDSYTDICISQSPQRQHTTLR